ncbi:MAG: hypothetical protein K6E97_04550 [Treponema sp.]|nr:hypothetical protein [Treponema sp.]
MKKRLMIIVLLFFAAIGFSEENIFNKDYIFSYCYQGFYEQVRTGDFRFQFDYEEYWKDYEASYGTEDYSSNKDGEWGYTEQEPSEPHYWKKYYNFIVIHFYEDKIQFGSNCFGRTDLIAIPDTFEIIEDNILKYHILNIKKEDEELYVNSQYFPLYEKQTPFNLLIKKDGDYLKLYLDKIDKENFLFELTASSKKDIKSMENFTIGKVSEKPKVSYPKYSDGRSKYIIKDPQERKLERGKYYRLLDSCDLFNSENDFTGINLDKNDIVLFLNYEEITPDLPWIEDFPNDTWVHIFLYNEYNNKFIDGYTYGSYLHDCYLEESEIPELVSVYVKSHKILEDETEVKASSSLPLVIIVASTVILLLCIVIILIVRKKKRQ